MFYRTSPVVASEGFRFPACNFITKETPEKMIFCEFCKISKDIFFFDRTPLDDCFLCLSVNSETIFRILLLQSTSGKLVFYLQVAEFKPPFIYLKPLKTVCEEVNLLWICLHFLRRHQNSSSVEALQVSEHNFFLEM